MIRKIKRKTLLVLGTMVLGAISFLIRSSSKDMSLFSEKVYADVAPYDQAWVDGLGGVPGGDGNCGAGCGGCSSAGSPTDSGGTSSSMPS